MSRSDSDELEYYRREFNELGGVVFRLQEDQSRWFREAQRSRAAARLILGAYRHADSSAGAPELASYVLGALVEHTFSERAMMLRRGEGNDFDVVATLGFDSAPERVTLAPVPPEFLFASPASRSEEAAAGVFEILAMPHLLWSADPASGYALALGHRGSSHIQRPFEEGDRELVEAALGAFVDVVRRREAEEATQAARDEAERARAALSVFVARFSHELRTPLTSVLGYADLISHNAGSHPEGEKLGRYALRIQEAGRHLLAMINDILDVAKIDQAELRLDFESVAIRPLIDFVIGSFEPLAVERRITVTVAPGPQAPAIWGDERRIRQMLLNLMANAIKFTPDGGSVTVEVREEDEWLCVVVSDTGVGMKPEEVPVALEPFSQLRTTPDVAAKGAGLGLAITRSLIQAHGGSITIVSEPNAGTSVELRFPLGVGARAPEPEAPRMSAR